MAGKPASAARGVGAIALVSLLIVCLCIISAYILIDLRKAARDRAIEVAGRLVAAIENDVQRNVESIDLSLQAVVDGLNRPDFHHLSPELRQLLLFDRSATARHLGLILVTDEHGIVRIDSRTLEPKPASAADRDYFQVHRDSDRAGLYISAPIFGRLTGKDTIALSRRLSKDDGSFAGVVAASLQLEYFRNLFANVALGEGSSVTLANTDGIILMRWPYDPKHLGLSVKGTQLYRQLGQSPSGHYESNALADGVSRLIVYRKIGGLPLIIGVGQATDAVYAQWRHYTTILSALAIVFVAIIGVLLVQVTRQLRNRARSARNLAAALANISQGLSMFDDKHNLVVCNEKYAKIYGLTREQSRPGMPFREILELRSKAGNLGDSPDQYLSMLLSRFRDRQEFSVSHTTPDGRTIAVVHRPMHGGGWVATHEDISERTRREAEVAHLARHDALTDLANRTLFRERIEQALGQVSGHAGHNGSGFAVHLLDLDKFKLVNDTLGHLVGDALLKAIAGRLKTCTGEADTIARLGGDEFAVLQIIEENQPQECAIVMAVRLLEAIGAPYEIDGHKISIGVSIGIALAPGDGADAGTLLKYADLAMYSVKSDGRNNYRLFENKLDQAARDRRLLEEDMRSGIERGQFELFYQPLVDLSTLKATSAEALIRWHHPQQGLLQPSAFIGLAEETGLVVPLGEWALRAACQAAATWPDHIKVAVNLSPVQFNKGNLVDSVIYALSESGLEPYRLQLEITESVLLEHSEDNLSAMHQLRSLGVGIVLDDFGTGFSSLIHVQKFPFDKIKIDQSFIRDLPHNSNSAAIICAVNGLARGLNIATVAEGVETTEQLQLVRLSGCAEAQGFLFCEPRPAPLLEFDVPALQAAAGQAA